MTQSKTTSKSVLNERYPSLERVKEHEKHFGAAILSFRKVLGFKNSKNNIKPEDVVLVDRQADIVGWRSFRPPGFDRLSHRA
ncbi:MAG: hypothetical protein ACYC9O_05690, partial [Candidatus Latescibacterota bacterium]